jgi:LmbE family N-acetylglucosaminyl deacetylase
MAYTSPDVTMPLSARSAAGFAAIAAIAAITATTTAETGASTQPSPRTLVALLAHADDEGPIAPLVARYAREGVKVYFIIASDGNQGAGSTGFIPRADSGPRGDELVRARAAEARCSAEALGAQPPILLGFPDGKLGDYAADRTLLYRLTDRIAQEFARLRPDAIITWGPDGGTGHPDHRLVSNIATQLMRAGAPGVPERLFYMNLPAEAFRAMNPQRGEPPLLIPQSKYFTVRVPFTPADLGPGKRSMLCHRSQFTPEIVDRVVPLQARAWNGSVSLIPAVSSQGATDLFK